MASSSGTYCDICQSRHISKTAEEYCPVCEEALCSDCKDHHNLAKATKNHQVISIAEYNKLPAFIREIKQHCDKHGDRFEFFCPTHNELCCKRCITTTHNECKECKVIEDFVESSAAIDEYEQTLKDVEENIQTAIADRKNNVEEFEKQTQAISKQIKNKRIEINRLFDNLEATIMKELFTIKSEKKQNVQSVIEKLEENKNKNIHLREDVEAMKKYGSNIQVFMGTTKLQQPVSSQERFVRLLQDDESLRFVNLECSISEELNNINTRIRSFGTVKPITSKSRVRFSWESDKSAQILTTPTNLKSIDNINTKLICMIDINTSNTITSCVLGKGLLFSTTNRYRGKILQYDTQGKHLKEIELKQSYAFDIVLIDLDTIAVTGGGCDFKVYIVDVATLQVKLVIDVGKQNWIYGATYKNESIISCMYGNAIQIFNIANNKNVTTSTLPFKTKYTITTYLASDDYFVYHSDYRNGSVACYDLRGKIIWSFKEDVLREPRSICLDSYSNVYVAGSGSNNVVVISSDGLHSKQLLGPDDGIKAPHAIHYDKSSNRLLVANANGPALLYQVSS
ncbi:E3 ubiquitin-protein ligase TRIM39-like [Mytilus edulis]|uniref:E3 ubiquitin-protein ligase TRIM39-like n=1 Tax=Mytilus edulis TaxID=6550 RepID=UPI0039EF4BEE